jgi:hypothetical protein
MAGDGCSRTVFRGDDLRAGRQSEAAPPHSDAMGLRGFGRSDKMNDQRNHREQEQQVN